MKKKCKSCLKDIDAKVNKCPHCKVDQRNWFVRHLIVIGIFALVIILGLIAISKYVGSANYVQSEQNQPTPTTDTRHDNSGAGADTGGNASLQGHMQHFGL